jgi:hypothetical protein
MLVTLFTRSALSRVVNLDARTLSRRIKTLRVEPEAVLSTGEPLYGEGTLHSLEAQQKSMADLTREARAFFSPGFKPQTTSTSIQ